MKYDYIIYDTNNRDRFMFKKDEENIFFSLPGIKKENVSIKYSDCEVVLSVKESTPFIDSGEFKVTNVFPYLYDVDNIKSNLENGVLHLYLPKKKKKEVNIKVD